MTDYSRSNILLPHFEEAEAFLNALDGKDAQFTFQTFDDVEVWSDEKQKTIKRMDKSLVRVYHGTFNEHKQTLAAINKRGGGVFVTINETDLKGRKKENILKVRAVFVDLDGSPIQPILDLEEDLQPHIIIESSPNKWHAYWLVDNCSLELFPLVQRALAAKFDGDISVNNIDRVMRLSGFSHNKGESFITRIHTMQDDLYPYSMNKLIVGLGLELEQPTQKKQTSNSTNSGDFEAVKRAAQGRWPAIFSRIGITLPPDNKHAPCPACGGTDRFRYDDIDGHGTFICNQGGNGILSGDGFALIQHKTGATSSEVLNMVRSIVLPDYQKSKKAVPHSQDGTAPLDDDLARESIDDNAASCELPDPLPIKQSLAPVMPFSADLLPHTLREFVMDESDRMPCPPDFVAVSILTTLGSTIGASCGIKPKQKDDGWIIVPNQWGGIVAPPTSLKTPAMEAGIKPLNKLIEEAIKNHESELKTHKRDELAYQARLEGLHADLKSASKTTARKKAEHTANELVDLIMEAEDNAPPPPVMRRYLTNDATIEKLGELERDNPNGILLMRDELMGWLAGLEKEGKQEDRAFYLEGFNGTGSKVVDRIMRGSTFIENHCLSVLGGIQPDKLIAYFEQQISGLGNDGLLQRFQLLVYPDAMTWGYRDRYQNKDALNAILELFKKLSDSDFLEFGAYPIDEYNKRPYFRFTLDAQAFFIEWLKKLNTEIIANEENTLIQQHLGKYARLMPSLALIFHLVDCVTHNTQGQVGLESAKQAVNWCEYLETHARRVYGLFDGMGMRPAVALSQKLKVCLNPTAKTDETSEDWLKDGFVFRDIRRKQWQHLKDDISIKKALTVLLDNHWIYPVSVKSASNGGRPTTRYYISQKLKVCLNPTAKTDETQKTNNSDSFFEHKTGFGSFGSTILDDFEILKNDDIALSLNDECVNSANSTKWEVDL